MTAEQLEAAWALPDFSTARFPWDDAEPRPHRLFPDAIPGVDRLIPDDEPTE